MMKTEATVARKYISLRQHESQLLNRPGLERETRPPLGSTGEKSFDVRFVVNYSTVKQHAGQSKHMM